MYLYFCSRERNVFATEHIALYWNQLHQVGWIFLTLYYGKKTVLCVLGDQRFQPTSNQVETDGKSLVVTAVVCCDLCLLASMFSVNKNKMESCSCSFNALNIEVMEKFVSMQIGEKQQKSRNTSKIGCPLCTLKVNTDKSSYDHSQELPRSTEKYSNSKKRSLKQSKSCQLRSKCPTNTRQT